MHWSDKYMGMEYDEDSFDCATFALTVAHERGINASLPTYTLKDRQSHALICEFRDDYAKPVDAPIDGHPVILLKDGKPSHIGVCVKIYEEWHIQHNVEKMGVIRQPMYMLEGRIEGFYQWLT